MFLLGCVHALWSFCPGFSLFRLKAFIEKYVPGAKLVEDNSMEVCFQLPETAARSGEMTALFAELEKVYSLLGISSYGISDTSLEEVIYVPRHDTLKFCISNTSVMLKAPLLSIE